MNTRVIWRDVAKQDLADVYLYLGERAPERLALETEPGVTMAVELHGLAVHNAYHLGKIVALRQILGAWPPKVEAKES